MGEKKDFPEGTKFSNWSLMYETREDKRVYVIRRWVYFPDGKRMYQRHPYLDYRHLRDNLKELRNYVIRLNGEDPDAVRVKRVVEFRHAFIGPDLLDSYVEFLKTRLSSAKHAESEYRRLYRYGLRFFIVKLRKPMPLDWHRHQGLWAKALLNNPENDPAFRDEWRLLAPNQMLSAKTLRSVVNAMNRFLAYLHQERPTEVRPLSFKPIGAAKFKDHDERRKIANKTVPRKPIPDIHWMEIQKHLPENLKLWSQLAYYYGLRRSEAMAVDLQAVRKDYLQITKQLIALPEPDKPQYGPLKSRMSRKVPHWFCKASVAYRIIEKVRGLEPMHPGTLSHKWLEIMREIGYDYDFHDIRHTWITKSVRLKDVNHLDVQRAAGHAHFSTTEGYIHDDREMSDDYFIPDKSDEAS